MQQNTFTTDQTSTSSKLADKRRPYYFSRFQNCCCNPTITEKESNRSKYVLPIPVKFADDVKGLVEHFNRFLVEQLSSIPTLTCHINEEFFGSKQPYVDEFLIDVNLFHKMTNHYINWMPNLNKLYPIQTSGEFL